MEEKTRHERRKEKSLKRLDLKRKRARLKMEAQARESGRKDRHENRINTLDRRKKERNYFRIGRPIAGTGVQASGVSGYAVFMV